MESKKTAEILKGIWEHLTDEQKAKAKACKTADELIRLAGEEGIELPDEMLTAVVGGVQAGSILKGGEGEFSGYENWAKKSGGC